MASVINDKARNHAGLVDHGRGLNPSVPFVCRAWEVQPDPVSRKPLVRMSIEPTELPLLGSTCRLMVRLGKGFLYSFWRPARLVRLPSSTTKVQALVVARM
jgi:hypothetical protein